MPRPSSEKEHKIRWELQVIRNTILQCRTGTQRRSTKDGIRGVSRAPFMNSSQVLLKRSDATGARKSG